MMTAAGLDGEMSPDLLGNAIKALVDRIDEDSSLSLIKNLMEGLEINDGDTWRPVVQSFDVDFAGKILHMLKVLKEVVVFQFGDFPEGLAAMGGALQQKTAPTSKVKAKKTA
jgi:hypothetical protein